MSNWKLNGPFLELFDEENASWVPYCEAFGVREKTVDLLGATQMVTLFVDLRGVLAVFGCENIIRTFKMPVKASNHH